MVDTIFELCWAGEARQGLLPHDGDRDGMGRRGMLPIPMRLQPA